MYYNSIIVQATSRTLKARIRPQKPKKRKRSAPIDIKQIMAEFGIHHKDLADLGIARSTVTMAINRRPIKRETAEKLFSLFQQQGYTGTLEELFVIGRPGARNDRRATPGTVQRPRKLSQGTSIPMDVPVIDPNGTLYCKKAHARAKGLLIRDLVITQEHGKCAYCGRSI